MPKRHSFFWKLLLPLVRIFLRIKFNYTCERVKDAPEKFIVLANHTTDFDPLFVGSSFKNFMRFVGSEHIARWKVFPLLKFAFDPIMRYKGMTASSAVMEMIRTVRGGTSVCMFAEGVRSWDGLPSPILPATGKVIKSAKCALITYRISGGYFSSPMWSAGSGTRKGRLHGRPVNIYTAEQLSKMSVAEINDIINADLYEDAYEVQKQNPVKYKGKNLAEKLETMLFICPQCGEMDTISSKGDTVSCSGCGHSFTYDEYGMLHGCRFDTVRDLSLWQKNEIAKHAETVTYTSPAGTLIKVEKHEETPLYTSAVTMTAEKLTCGDYEFNVADLMDLAMHGRHALVFSTNDGYYEIIVENGGNALKYQLLFNALKKSVAEV
ncbi:MAG: hypothetical protein IJC91_01250 [Oscillospiraceae bacterium]|nr:hypothetical protein [Oscillospiraceae bacterium]